MSDDYCDAYDYDDPKHPTWLARQIEAADNRDKLPE